jgi:hypothetical protein
MSYTNRYSSYNGQNDYKSYSYSTQPQQQQQQRSVSWRPPRYIPSSYLTSSKTATATTAPPQSQTKTEDLQEEEEIDSSNILTLATQITDELQAEVDYNMHEVGTVKTERKTNKSVCFIYLPPPFLFFCCCHTEICATIINGYP